MTRAKPCPRCGAFGAAPNETIVTDSAGVFSYFIVRCQHGHTATTYGEATREQAINLWNSWNGVRRFSLMHRDRMDKVRP